MNSKLIQRRAEVLHELLDSEINRGSSYMGREYFDAYKATYALKERSVSRFKKTFKESGPDFSITNVELAYEDFADDIPGIRGLMIDERQLLKEIKSKIY